MRYAHPHHNTTGGVWGLLRRRKHVLYIVILLFCLFFALNVLIANGYLPFSSSTVLPAQPEEDSHGKTTPPIKIIKDEPIQQQQQINNNNPTPTPPPPPTTVVVTPPTTTTTTTTTTPPPPPPKTTTTPSSPSSSSTSSSNSIVKTSDYHPIYNQLLSKLAPGYDPSSFFIAIVATDRPQYLTATLRSLSQVLYWNRENTVVYQYGDDAKINQIVSTFKLKQIKNPKTTMIDGRPVSEGAEHISYHYRFVMNHVFSNNPSLKHFIIVEDDMLFAPDFLLYFAQLAPVMDKDPMVYAISAYNDNGFMGKATLDNMAYRTDFFIGLGWLVSRKHWTEEWSRHWPRSHWDHFLRASNNRKGRHTLYPEVSRVYHSGYQGTHSTVAMYEQYFRDIVLNSHGFAPLGISEAPFKNENDKKYVMNVARTDAHTIDYLYSDEYGKFFFSMLDPNNPDTIYVNDPKQVEEYKNKNLVFLLTTDHAHNRAWLYVSKYFDIWHTIPVRGSYDDIPMFKFNGNRVFFIFSFSHHFSKYSQHGKALDHRSFHGKKPTIPHSESIIQINVADNGVSCSRMCYEKYGEAAKCDTFKLEDLNNCASLRHYFNCDKCEGSIGNDQPALNAETNTCLYNSGSNRHRTTCQGFHASTKRLCACFDPARVSIFHDEWEAMISNAHKQATEPFMEP